MPFAASGRRATGLVTGVLVPLLMTYTEDSSQFSRLDQVHISTHIAHSAKHGNQGTLYHILVDSNTPNNLLSNLALHVRGSLDVSALANGVFLVVVDVHVDVEVLESTSQTREGAVAATTELNLLAIHGDNSIEDTHEISDTLRLSWSGGGRS